MARNVEIKAHLVEPDEVRARVFGLATSRPETMAQHDTFFVCSNGRLKLRDFGNGRAELIHYHRDDRKGPKLSTYNKVEVARPAELRRLLAAAYGELGEVRKRRTVLLVGQTRVHLDEVDRLGNFLELEVVLDDEQSITDGERIAEELLRRLGLDWDCLEARAYVDLLGFAGEG